MLSLLLDATAVPADRRGVGRYVDNLIPALARTGVQVQAVCQPRDAEYYGTVSGCDVVLAPDLSRWPATRLLWEQVGLPKLIASVRPDVVHAPHYTHPVAVKFPLVITLHDATFFTDPEAHTAVKGPVFRAATKLALRRAEVCVVPSQSTADELVRVAGADPARLQVAYHGVNSNMFSPPTADAVERVRRALKLADGQEYVAFLGTLEPRKNLPALIRGWVAACDELQSPPALVLAGGAGWDDAVAGAIASVPARLKIIRPGYLPQDQLAGYLGGAVVVAYPSLAEGFGLPVLEAMACGAAVLTTRRTSLPEVGGDAVEYTDVGDAAIGTALTSLLANPARRAELSAAATRRAGEFTWDRCAQAHLQAYERAKQQGRRPW